MNVCYHYGRLEALIKAPQLAGEFANVADELHAALGDVASSVGADTLSTKQLNSVSTELARVTAPCTEAQQQTVSRWHNMSEILRVMPKDQKSSEKQRVIHDLQIAVAEILDGCASIRFPHSGLQHWLPWYMKGYGAQSRRWTQFLPCENGCECNFVCKQGF
jgi:hypothetical protein